jgi:hypothetical protein
MNIRISKIKVSYLHNFYKIYLEDTNYTCFLSSPFSIVIIFIVPQSLHFTLRSFTFQKAEEVFEKAREYNRSKGYVESLSKAYINYNEPLPQRKYERFLNQVTNPDTGAWNTMKYLKATNQVARGIESEFDDVSYPRIELYQLFIISIL